MRGTIVVIVLFICMFPVSGCRFVSPSAHFCMLCHFSHLGVNILLKVVYVVHRVSEQKAPRAPLFDIMNIYLL